MVNCRYPLRWFPKPWEDAHARCQSQRTFMSQGWRNLMEIGRLRRAHEIGNAAWERWLFPFKDTLRHFYMSSSSNYDEFSGTVQALRRLIFRGLLYTGGEGELAIRQLLPCLLTAHVQWKEIVSIVSAKLLLPSPKNLATILWAVDE